MPKSKLSTARYGRKLRNNYATAFNLRKSKYNCNFCDAEQSVVKSTMVGLWKCKKCEKIFVGSAYSP